MKKFLMIVPAALLSACATTGASLKPVTVDPTAAAQQQRIVELEARLAELEARPAVQPAAQQEVEQAEVVPVNQQVRVIPPPAQPEPMGPPQHWAWPYTPPSGCEDGSFRLRLMNWSRRYFARVFIDGKEIEARFAPFPAPDGTMMTPIPPSSKKGYATTFNVCLAHLGEHEISGVLYESRMGQLMEVGSFTVNQKFGARGNTTGHVFRIDSDLIQN